ncbi:hypothetical protein [Mucilaginibacter arboris]|uniref:Uncharacterized protein n=1 Tax=Mucilaginibacter arboris TaxID=2682090 RepID=A0A7K1T114_9SPHI|nr:hypothetical protein [Mucilaginibacter arboris]MVN23272.1 hypothetical protein [Mucilaginibacter arboris]
MSKKPSSEKTSITWKTWGMKYDRTKPDEPIENGEIDIFEECRSVNMDSKQKPYGRPIDADTAVHLISNYIKFVEEAFPHLNLKSENLSAEHLDFVDTTLIDIFKVSYGITYDKNILLKLLSQPKCEGIRSYLCLREPKKNPHISLVLVGVDCDGNDLHYRKKDTIKKNSSNGIDEITTQSLTGEFAHPPESSLEKKLTDPRYALLKMANDSK